MLFPTHNPVIDALILCAYLGSLIHVYIESRGMKDRAILHVFMVAVVAWPLGYILWLVVWPATLREWLFRKANARSECSKNSKANQELK